MQPIPTKNAMNPAPAKGIESFPTPVIDDVVISEVVNSWKGDYKKLEYGTLWKDVPHAPNQGSFPEHKLVFQEPTSEDGQWVKRIWVNDRANQDSYNYAIKYSAGSQEHPIYIRTYIVPRETYAPLLDGTPDPLFPGALLVDEEAVRNEGELDSKYITVTRVYETIPGPQVPTKRYNERGDLETVIVQTVPPFTQPDPDGLLVTGSQVVQEEMGKGIKTTSTVQDHSLLQIKENKEGLLGETITTDDIVSPSTNPDPLSQTVVASTVEQYTATKARKRTTTSIGPKELKRKSKDGKLLGDVTLTESVVDPNANPDSVSTNILSSEVKQVDSGKAIKTNVVLNSTPILSGRQNEQGLLGAKTTTESIVSAGTPADPLSLSVISSDVEPIDSVRSRKVTVTSTGPLSLIGGQKQSGLMGETSINESIVPSGSNPDELTKYVVSSVVEPIDSAKSKKTTVTFSGPVSLKESSKDGKLLGDVVSTESIVDPNTLPDSPNPTIISSQVKQIDSGKAIKTNVVLNSTPTLSGNQSGEGLLGVRTISESIVPAGSEADPVSSTVISSQVEPIDSVRSRKVTTRSLGPKTLVGAQKSEGLLGETTIKESIVDAGESADDLNTSIISSRVDPIDSAKSKKTTVTSSGPKSLTKKTNDGKLLGNVEVTESVVAPSSNPDSLSGVTSGVIQSEVRQVDSGKAIKQTTKLVSSPILSSQTNESGLLGIKSTTERIVAAGSAPDDLSKTILSSSVEAIDSQRSKKTTVISSGPTLLKGDKKSDGLLGETTVEESIVDAGSAPDDLSKVVLSSEVTPIDSSKSKKTTVKRVGNASLTQKSRDGKLLGNVTVTESIVDPNESPDSPSGVSNGILSSEVKQIDTGKAVKINTVLNSTPILKGSESKPGLLGQTEISETVVPAGTPATDPTLNIVSSTVEPIDESRSKLTTVTSSGPTVLKGQRINERGETEIISEFIVPSSQNLFSNQFFDTSQEIVPIDSAKSKRTISYVTEYATLGVKESKPGLLGNTETVEEMVPPTRQPDELSQTVLSSSIEKISDVKAVKKTTRSTGPTTLSGVENKDGLLGQTQVTESIVPAGSPADPVSLEVISSVVEPIDSSKSKKTTITSSGPNELTGKTKKPGLLGITKTIESIVSADSDPDELSISVLQSGVEPIDSSKSKKTTVTSDGPLELVSKILSDSPTGAINAVKYTKIVDPNETPINSLTTLKYEVNAIDKSKSESEKIEVESWPLLQGVEFDEVTGIPIPYTEQVISPDEYNENGETAGNTTYKPIDEFKTLKKQYKISEIQERFLAALSQVETPVQVKLPDKLVDVIAYISRDYSEGSNKSKSNSVSGDSYGYDTGGGYKSSGSISADIYFKIEKGFDGYIDGKEVIFYVREDPSTPVPGERNVFMNVYANVLSALNDRLPEQNITLWPTIKKVTQNILVFTGGKSKTVSDNESVNVSINGNASSSRQDWSYEIDTNVNSVVVPDALYDAITIKKEEFGAEIPSDLQITGGVYPQTLAPTNPPKFPPGNYLISSSVSQYRFGLLKITAVIARITEDFV